MGQTEMGNGHLLHPHQAGRTVPIHDPGSLRQQYCGLQTGTEQTVGLVLDTIRLAMKREKRRLLQNSTSTATRDSVHLASILQPDSSIRHYTVHVKKGKSI